MKTDEQKQFVIMQENIKTLQTDVQEIKVDVKELIKNLDQRFMDMANHNSSEIVKATLEFKNEVDNLKKQKANKWVEKVLIWAGGIVGAIFLSSAVYIIFSNGLK